MVNYQGAVPQGYDIDKFRKTGITSKIVKDKSKKSKKLKKQKEKRILTKPKAKLPSYDPTKMLMKGVGSKALVSEGRTKYFDEEYREETKWLS